MTSSGSAAMTGVDVVVVTYKSAETVADAVEPLDRRRLGERDRRRQRLGRRHRRPAPARCPSRRSRSRRTAASRTAATSAGAPAARRTSSSSTRTRGSGPMPLATLVAELDARRARRRGRAADRGARRLARLLAPPLPAPALELRAGALPPPRLSRGDVGGRGDPRSGRVRACAPCRVGLRRLLRRAPERARGDRRPRRELLPLQRGRRHLRADLAIGARGAVRAGGARRARGRRVGATRAAAADPRRQPDPLLGEARLGAGACSPPARASRSGRRRTSSLARSAATRRGHLRALGVALRPLPAEPSHLVRGT